jgi:hypothetical protein
LNPESELSTEDLAWPGEARQDQRSTADTPQEQLPRDPGAGDPGLGGDPTYASAQGTQRQEGAPGVEQQYDEQPGMGAAPGGPGASAMQQPGRAGAVDDSLGDGDRGAVPDTGGQRPGDGISSAGGGPAGDAGAADVALLVPADEDRFRQRWADVQARFVDDPQEAVRTADGLVAELMQSLAQGFSEHKGSLEAQWQSGGDPDTEELRQALQRYRSFFDRLLST